MHPEKHNIIQQLKKDILALQGLKSTCKNTTNLKLGPIVNSFPNSVFPTAAIHEFLCPNAEDLSAASGFISGLLAPLMHNQGISIWITGSNNIFPPALKNYGVDPSKIIFLNLKTEKDILWAAEEALHCNNITAAVAEIKNLNFTASRRLQLAVEHSNVTGFILRQTETANTTACISRWKISSIPSELPEGMPGVGYPRWKVELLKIRNGTPGCWEVEFAAGKFLFETAIDSIEIKRNKKVG